MSLREVDYRRKQTHRPKQYRCKDGHFVKSLIEKKVDDILSSHGIHHVLYPPVPRSSFLADFKVGDSYIEVWGLEGHSDYDKRKKEKIKHYKKYNIALLGISTNDSIAAILGPLIKQKNPDLDDFQKALDDRRIALIDSEIELLKKKIHELRRERDQIVRENVGGLRAPPIPFPDR